jgi:hypothetical protein
VLLETLTETDKLGNVCIELAVRFFICIEAGQSVKLLLAFASTVIPGFSLLEFCDQSLSQSYFTTDGLPPVSSSWRQAP